MTLLERFDAFFAELNTAAGKTPATPYPWQRRMVAQIASTGQWPTAIVVPTGAGKSSAIDIHVFLVAEAALAEGQLARPPRRLVMVAPRRVLVDDQHERARAVAQRLAEADPVKTPALYRAATALHALRSADDSQLLGVTALRGGMRLDRRWRLDPSQCQVICITPQMWGSIALFRGYLTSRLSRQLEAGLLTHDAAVVIDEAHLHRRLLGTARALAAHDSGVQPLQVTEMTATSASSLDDTDCIRLTDEDLSSPLGGRVHAVKHVRTVPTPDWSGAAVGALATEARARAAQLDLAALAGPRTVGVFVNTVARARAVAKALATLERGATIVSVNGRMRPADLTRLRDAYPGVLDTRGNDSVRYLVSTQSLEVGVDLDLASVVTELAPASALAQRAGRLNRTGRIGPDGNGDQSQFVVVVPGGPLELSEREALPYSLQQLAKAETWLRGLDGSIAPARVASSAIPVDALRPGPPVTKALLRTLAATSVPLAADPDPALYIEDSVQDENNASVAVRKVVGDDRLTPAAIRAALLAAPPRAHEVASVPLSELRRAALTEGHLREGWVMRVSDGVRDVVPVSSEGLGLRPGDTLIVAEGSQVMRGATFEVAKRPSPDRADDVCAARPDDEGPPDICLTCPTSAVQEALAIDPTLKRRAARSALLHAVDDDAGSPDARKRLRERLSDTSVSWCADPADLRSVGGNDDAQAHGVLVIVSVRREGGLLNPPGDALVSIDDHQAAVAARAATVIDRLGLAHGTWSDAVLTAAALHDEGKRHPRFQQRMGRSEEEHPDLAKPAPGHRPDRGDGWRHEQLSAAAIAARTNRDALTMALGAGHHGHGYPMFARDATALLDGWPDCPPDVQAEAHELFGPGGTYELLLIEAQHTAGIHQLAYLTALLRCADMQVSGEGQ